MITKCSSLNIFTNKNQKMIFWVIFPQLTSHWQLWSSFEDVGHKHTGILVSEYFRKIYVYVKTLGICKNFPPPAQFHTFCKPSRHLKWWIPIPCHLLESIGGCSRRSIDIKTKKTIFRFYILMLTFCWTHLRIGRWQS